MEIAYITSHNSFKVVKRNNCKDITLTGEIYKSKISLFSKYEESCLLAVQELMKNPEKFFTEVYDPIVSLDTRKYIFKEQQPAYHLNKSCSRLKSDFKNFELPNEIRLKGEGEVERFREWFKQNSKLINNTRTLEMRIHAAFGININLKPINHENSGFAEFNNYTLEELEREIDILLKVSVEFYNDSQKNTTILNSFGKRTNLVFNGEDFENDTDYTKDEIRTLLDNYYSRFKNPVQKLLIEYYRVKLNPDLAFVQNLLEALGFKICGTCHRNDEMESERLNWEENWKILMEVEDSDNDDSQEFDEEEDDGYGYTEAEEDDMVDYFNNMNYEDVESED